MSRVGNKILEIPQGVEVTIADGNLVTVKGPKGQLTKQFSPAMVIEANDGKITVKRTTEQKHHKQLHGTTNAIIKNMIIGVSQGYEKELEIVGLGYRASLQGKTLNLQVGYSHPVNVEIEDGVDVEVPTPTTIKLSGIDKERVGEVAAIIRAWKKPEPYKGKGIKYKDEIIRRKEGKKAGK